LDDHESRLSEVEKLLRGPIRVPKLISVKELILSKGPKSDNDRTLVIGFYLESKGAVSFTVKDLQEGFREARERVPNNINLCVLQNIKKGLMMEAGTNKGPKLWNLTAPGERYVEQMDAGNQASKRSDVHS
jgi:hypothetical protein